MRLTLLFSLVIIGFILGCSNGGGLDAINLPQGNEIPAEEKYSTSHVNWGLWQFMADPEKGTLDVVMLRSGSFHINALPFIDQPPLVYLTLESLEFNGNIIETDIGLRHPFIGLDEFTGFDVKGILITNGSLDTFTDGDLVMAADGDTRLLNPDGFSRWWNPSEFPQDGTMFGYYDGALGAKDSDANYNCTLNAYKYYCDDLTGSKDPLSGIDPEGRGVFSAGSKNIRHYTIELGSEGLVFNYAVDASWQFPQGEAPWVVPDDFNPAANQPEVYRIEVTELEGSSLYYDTGSSTGGGDLYLAIDVYDWYGAELNTLKVEWPDFAEQAVSGEPTGGGVGYSTYEVDLIDCTPSGIGEQQLFITVESDETGYGDKIPGAPVSSYFFHTTTVSEGIECGDTAPALGNIYTLESNPRVLFRGCGVLNTGPYDGHVFFYATPGGYSVFDPATQADNTPVTNWPAITVSGFPVVFEVGRNNGLMALVSAGSARVLRVIDQATGNTIQSIFHPYDYTSAMAFDGNDDIWLIVLEWVDYGYSDPLVCDYYLQHWTYDSNNPSAPYSMTDQWLVNNLFRDDASDTQKWETFGGMVVDANAEYAYVLTGFSPIDDHRLDKVDITGSSPFIVASYDFTGEGLLNSGQANMGASRNPHIDIDYSDESLEHCRIIVTGNTPASPNYNMNMYRFDDELTLLGSSSEQYDLPGSTWLSGMAIDIDNDMIVHLNIYDFPSTETYYGISQLPADW